MQYFATWILTGRLFTAFLYGLSRSIGIVHTYNTLFVACTRLKYGSGEWADGVRPRGWVGRAERRNEEKKTRRGAQAYDDSSRKRNSFLSALYYIYTYIFSRLCKALKTINSGDNLYRCAAVISINVINGRAGIYEPTALRHGHARTFRYSNVKIETTRGVKYYTF